MKSNIRLIAFYLPQFYPTAENNQWWGNGFTEWTNVAKAKPLFKGHYQPKIPADLGFYDLRLPEVREQQVELAREAGIEGFCYWHYWFAGRRLLDRVFNEVVESGKPDFPFCLCWANHSWYKKTWESTKSDLLLIEQTYPGIQDYENHFYALLPSFKDKRYMKMNGRLIFGIFESDLIPSFNEMREVWERLAKDNGLPGFYFFGLCQGEDRLEKVNEKNYDTVVYEHMKTAFKSCNIFSKILKHYLHRPNTLNYSQYSKYTIQFLQSHTSLTPCLLPNFDHSPRSGLYGWILKDSTPDKWYHLCYTVREIIENRRNENNLVFIKAWNEWGEGNYLEPDLKYGKCYIEKTHKAFFDVK